MDFKEIDKAISDWESKRRNSLDINNCSSRKIRCISNSNDVWGCGYGGNLLAVGEIYNLKSLAAHGWHTEIELKEFPNKMFNSVLFEEMGDNDV